MALWSRVATRLYDAVFAACVGGLVIAGAAPRSTTLTPCHPAALGVDARCGVVDVPENWGQPAGRRISLRVVVVPAKDSASAPDPMFVLVGGPGQAATEQGWVIRYFEPVRATRDLVLVDQRGTGQSHPLRCEARAGDTDVREYFTALYPSSTVAACRQALRSNADLRQYTTTASARDLDAVRDAIGAARINLYGTSYGTRLALEYLRRFPRRVRTLILDGVVGPKMRSPRTFALDGQRAFDLLIQACRKDAACSKAYPDLASEFSKLELAWRRKPVSVSISGRPDVTPQTVEFDWGLAADTIRSLLYNTNTAARVPAVIDAAAHGDFGPLAQERVTLGRVLDQQLSLGLFLSVMCTEDDGALPLERVRRLTAGTFMGTYLIRQYEEACAEWPHGAAPADFHEPVRSDVPALFLSGWLDPVLPPFRSAAQLKAMPHAVRAVAMNGAHAFKWTNCVDKAIAQLVETGSEKNLMLQCMSEITRPAFVDKRRASVRSQDLRGAERGEWR